MSANRINPVRGICVLPQLPPWLAMTQGNIYHVKPSSGSDSNDGLSVDQPLKTLARAQTLATADQNDVVLLYSESNTAASTTDYQSSTLDWAKDGVHLIGVSSGTTSSGRARVALISTYDTASNLFTLSADNCYIGNIAFFAGVAGTNPTGCLKVTGSRNRIENCHIAGIGHDNNDIANAYSIQFYGCQDSDVVNCTIGLSTISRGTGANAEIRFLTGADSARVHFINCRIVTYASANTHQFVTIDASSLTDYIEFVGCRFINRMNASGSVALLEGFDITATGNDGQIHLHNCSSSGMAEWEAASGISTILYCNMPAASATEPGGVAYTAS